jgi:hypothetical protein
MTRPPITRSSGPLFARQVNAALDWLEENSGSGAPVAWGDVTGKPSTFQPASHGHIIGDVTGLQTALDGKQAAGSYLVAANLAAFLSMKPAAGEFIGNGMNATALGTQAQVANRTVIGSFPPLPFDLTIDQLGVSVSTFVASATIKCVIYEADENGRPITILRESPTIDAGSNGTRFATITSFTFMAGKKHWVGIRSSSTATLRTLGVGSAPALTYTNAATPAIESALILTETYANAAANWTYAASQHSNALVPLVLMRVA